ncbi:MAG: FAD-linked oxidase C-terminal domain-containing protein, partial [Chitinophagales bacterium]
ITKIVLRLLPHPQFDLLMLVPFRSATEACAAVNTVFMAGIIPSAMEFMERDAIDWTMQYVEGHKFPAEKDIAAHLLIEVDGNNIEQLMKEMELISGLMQQYDIGEILFAESSEQKQELWLLRRSVADAVKMHSVYKEEDTVVPRAELPLLLKGVKKIGARFGFKSVCYGHAGDGNLHVNIIRGTLSDSEWQEMLPKGIAEIFRLCVSLGGTISGEHGIGWVQKSYMAIAFSEKQLNLMKQIKNVFDPYGILNPGKIFAD